MQDPQPLVKLENNANRKEALINEDGVEISPRTGKPKRRKASRACSHCQRAHLTCENTRPCARCVQRGLAKTCVDGVRKKAKYLEDQASEPKVSSPLRPQPSTYKNPAEIPTHIALENARRNSVTPSSGHSPYSSYAGHSGQHASSHHSHRPHHQRRGNFTQFNSSTLNNEYSSIGDLINGDPIRVDSSPVTNSAVSNSSPEDSSTSASNNSWFEAGGHSKINQFSLGDTPAQSNLQKINDMLDSLNKDYNSVPDWMRDDILRPVSLTISDVPSHQQIESMTTGTGPTGSLLPGFERMRPRGRRSGADIYSYITTPYEYTPGYHGLISYLRSRFPREPLLKMARFMAKYRPSFIACTNSLSEEDLIFMEQSFQRTLLEYEKFMACSGTPTIAWRRTGEIAAVSREFSILTGWANDLLLGTDVNPPMFVVQLLDDDSVLAYFEMFSDIAFGDQKATKITSCSLLTAQGVPLKTMCIWTLKRDVFGIPMMIVGNFLPILK